MGKKLLCSLLVANPVAGWLLRHLLNYCYTRKAVNWFYRKMGLLEHAYGKASSAARTQRYFADYEVSIPAGRGSFVLSLYQGSRLLRSQMLQLTSQQRKLLIQNLVVEPGNETEIIAELQAEEQPARLPIKTTVKVQQANPVRKYPVCSLRQAAYENTRGLYRSGLLSYAMGGNRQNPTHLAVVLSDSSAGQDELNESSTIATSQQASQQHLFLEVQSPTFYGEVDQGDLARFQRQLRQLVERTLKRFSIAPESLTVVGLFGAATQAQDLAIEFSRASLVTSVRQSKDGSNNGSLSRLFEWAKDACSDGNRSGNCSGKSVHIYCEDDESLDTLVKKTELFDHLKGIRLYRLGDASEATVHAVRLSAWRNTWASNSGAQTEMSGLQLRLLQDGDYSLAQVRIMRLSSSDQASVGEPVVWLLGECSGSEVRVLLAKNPTLPFIHYLRKPLHKNYITFPQRHYPIACMEMPNYTHFSR